MGAVFFTSCRKDEEEIITPNPNNQNISCSAITSPTVWTNVGDGVDYYVDCNISVSAKLTIEPGVVIHFKNNASITIESAGALVAVGTASSPIVLEGDSPLAGYWKGIYIKCKKSLCGCICTYLLQKYLIYLYKPNILYYFNKLRLVNINLT